MKKKILLIASLLFTFIPAVFGAASPVLTRAYLDTSSGVEAGTLRLDFDQPLNTGSVDNGIVLSFTADGGLNELPTTIGLTINNYSWAKNFIRVTLDPVDLASVKTLPGYPTGLDISFGDSLVMRDDNLLGSAAVTFADIVVVEMGTGAPEPEWAISSGTYDFATGYLKFAANMNLKDANTNLSDTIMVRFDYLDTLFLFNFTLVGTPDDDTVTIALNLAEQTSFSNMFRATGFSPSIVLRPGIFFSMQNWGAKPEGYGIFTTQVNTPAFPDYSSGGFVGPDTVNLVFGSPLSDINTAFSSGLSLSFDNDAGRTLDLSTYSDISTFGLDDSLIQIKLTPSDRDSLLHWRIRSGGGNPKVVMTAGVVKNTALTESNVALVYNDYKEIFINEPNPNPYSVTVDAVLKTFTLNFTTPLDNLLHDTSVPLLISYNDGGSMTWTIPAGWTDTDQGPSVVSIDLIGTDAVDSLLAWKTKTGTEPLMLLPAGVFTDQGGVVSNIQWSNWDSLKVVVNVPDYNPSFVTFDYLTRLLDFNFNNDPDESITNASIPLKLVFNDSFAVDLSNVVHDGPATANHVTYTLPISQADSVRDGYFRYGLQNPNLVLGKGKFWDVTNKFSNDSIPFDYGKNITVQHPYPGFSFADLDGITGILSLNFQSALNDAATDSSLVIRLSTDNGGPNTVVLKGYWDQISTLNDNIYQIQLNGTDLTNLNTWFFADGQNMTIEMNGGIFLKQGGSYRNMPVVFQDDRWVNANFPNTDPSNITFDYLSRKLIFNFPSPVKDAAILPNGHLRLSWDGGNTTSIDLRLGDFGIVGPPDDQIVEYLLDLTTANNIKTLYESNGRVSPSLSLDAAVFPDTAQVISNQAIAYTANVFLNIMIPDINPVNYNIHTGTKKLKISFSDAIDDSRTNSTASIQIGFDSGNPQYTLSVSTVPDVSTQADDSRWEILLSQADIDSLVSWKQQWSNEPNISFAANIFMDSTGNIGNDSVGWTDNKLTSLKIAGPPKVTSAIFDEGAAQLRINFDQDLKENKIDTLISIRLSVDTGGVGTVVIPMSGLIRSGFDNSLVDIVLQNSELAALLALPNPGRLQLEVPANVFPELSETFSNALIPFDSTPVQFITLAPALLDANYNPDTNILRLLFNHAMDLSLTSTSGGVFLSNDGGGSQTFELTPFIVGNTGFSDNVDIQLTALQALQVESWFATDTTLTVSHNAGVFSDGNLTASPMTFSRDFSVFVGDLAPQLQSADLQYQQNILLLKFDKPLVSFYNNAYSQVQLSTALGGSFYLDQPLTMNEGSNSTELELSLSVAELNVLRNMSGIDSLRVTLSANMVFTNQVAEGNPSEANFPVNFIPDPSNPMSFVEARFFPLDGRVELQFDQEIHDLYFQYNDSIMIRGNTGESLVLNKPLQLNKNPLDSSWAILTIDPYDLQDIADWDGYPDKLSIEIPQGSFRSYVSMTTNPALNETLLTNLPALYVEDAVLFQAEKRLVLVFNRDVYQKQFGNGGQLRIRDSFGTNLLILQPPFVLTDVIAEYRELIVELTSAQMQAISAKIPQGLHFQVDSNVFLAPSYTGGDLKNSPQIWPIYALPNVPAPQILFSEYRTESGEFRIVLNAPVDTVEPQGFIGFSIDSATNRMFEMTVVEKSGVQMSGDTLIFSLNQAHQDTLSIWPWAWQKLGVLVGMGLLQNIAGTNFNISSLSAVGWVTPLREAPVFSINYAQERTEEPVPANVEWTSNGIFGNAGDQVNEVIQSPASGSGSDAPSVIPEGLGDGSPLTLQASTTYTFRLIPDSLLAPGAEFSLGVPARPVKIPVGIDYEKEQTSRSIFSMEEWNTSGFLSAYSTSFIGEQKPVSLVPGFDYFIRRRSTETSFSGMVDSLLVPARPAAPFYEVDSTQLSATITVPTDQEWSTDAFVSSSTAGDGGNLTLKAGTIYSIRYRATSTAFASEITELHLGEIPELDFSVVVAGEALQLNFAKAGSAASFDAFQFRWRLEDMDGVVLDSAVSLATLTEIFPVIPGRYLVWVFMEQSVETSSDNTTLVADSSSSLVIVPDNRPILADSGSWRLASFGSTVLDVDSFDVGTEIFRWNADVVPDPLYSQYAPRNELDSLVPGESYWMYPLETESLSLADQPEDFTSYKATLATGGEGWNMVGNPFHYPVKPDFEMPGDSGESARSAKFWRWDSKTTQFVPEDVLQPFEGYWVEAGGVGELDFGSSPYFGATGLSKQAFSKVLSKKSWTLRASLQAGSREDSWNFFGVAPDAENGKDLYDRGEPPRVGNFVSFLFKDGDRSLSTDLKSGEADLQLWNFEIFSTDRSIRSGEFSLDGLDEMESAGLEVRLITEDGSRVLRSGEKVQLSLNEKAVNYALLVGPKADFADLHWGMGIVEGIPEVVHGSFRFRVISSLTENVGTMSALVIRNLSGAEVDRVLLGSLRPGISEFSWQPARSSTPESGKYFYSLEVGGFSTASGSFLYFP